VRGVCIVFCIGLALGVFISVPALIWSPALGADESCARAGVAIKAVETKAAARNVTFFMVLLPYAGI
jgi:hypothetical protein